jgi:hypothetical protein
LSVLSSWTMQGMSPFNFEKLSAFMGGVVSGR